MTERGSGPGRERADIVIVGGGIGGLAAALALSRTGKRVCVLEQASEFAEIGAGVQLGPNSFRMLDRLGLVDEVNALSAFPDELVMRDSMTAEFVTRIPAAKAFRERFGHPYAVIHRADLHRALLRRCESAALVDLRTDAKVSGVDEHSIGVTATVRNGSVVEADALIGADGIWSATRALIADDGEARVSGHVAYRAVLPASEVPTELATNSMCLWAGEKVHLVQYPLRGGELYNLVAVFHSDRFSGGWNDFGDVDELNLRFADKCAEVRTLLGMIESWRMWVLCDREPTREWIRGRMALLGDAAHPMLQYLAQGANMAIEDAVCLADMLVNEGDDYERAFVRYRDARYLRTARVQMTARLYGEVYHASGATREMRNAEIGSWSSERHYAGMSWIYDVAPTWRDDGSV